MFCSCFFCSMTKGNMLLKIYKSHLFSCHKHWYACVLLNKLFMYRQLWVWGVRVMWTSCWYSNPHHVVKMELNTTVCLADSKGFTDTWWIWCPVQHLCCLDYVTLLLISLFPWAHMCTVNILFSVIPPQQPYPHPQPPCIGNGRFEIMVSVVTLRIVSPEVMMAS